MAQIFNLVVYEFGTTSNINFNYKIYRRDNTKSYRPGEKQVPTEDLTVWPNSPPVDINHILVESGLNVSSPKSITLDEDDSYYIMVWKSSYTSAERRFYIPSSTSYNYDSTLIGDFPADLYFEIQPISSAASNNAEVFV